MELFNWFRRKKESELLAEESVEEEMPAEPNHQQRLQELKDFLEASTDPQDPEIQRLTTEYVILSAYLRLSDERKNQMRTLVRNLTTDELELHLREENVTNESKFLRNEDQVIIFPRNGVHIEVSVSVFGLKQPDDAGFLRGELRGRAVQFYGGSNTLRIRSNDTPGREGTIQIAQKLGDTLTPRVEITK